MKETVCNVHSDQDAIKSGEHTYNGVIEFGMASVKRGSSSIQSICSSSNVGPLIHDGAPYSAIGIPGVRVLQANDIRKTNSISPKPKPMENKNSWRYGQGERASEPRKILGSISITARFDSGLLINITFLVLDGSLQ